MSNTLNIRWFCISMFLLVSGKLYPQVKPSGLMAAPEILNIETSGRDNKFQKSYNLKHHEDRIKVYLKPVEAQGQKVEYYFGIDKKQLFQESKVIWKKVDTPVFKFDVLLPGEYVFFVKYKVENGSQSESRSFDIQIERPWWRTWWFWGASFISLFGMFYGRERFLKFWADEEQRHMRQIVELELRTLQLQMNPHFIFNALNSIQSYVMTHDALTANNYLSKFAHLIRMFLDSSRSKYTSLNEEIRMLTLYIEMECLRFEDKFDFEIVVDSDVNKYLEIPTMILQPFVENAINHGLRYKRVKGLLSLRFYLEGNYLICRMVDNGVGRKNSKEIQSGTQKGYRSQGLKITEERLNTYNKINDTNIIFIIKDNIENPSSPIEDVGTVVKVKFPIN
ncbi:MAG: histidine kinase [Cytophagaceae bacterium]|nr:histidine kinase [Cytophagaceae bacterium]MBL0303057.1 histidine kinase [Cytophagaceae bacterium]MBL0325902.1 histidine kinase [Cytophagaceae bacterium]